MSGTPKRVWVMLALSAALNLFFFGVFAAQKLPWRDPFRGGFREHHERDGGGGGRKFLRHSGLRDAGPEVQALMKARREQARENMRALADARAEVRQSLKAEPFDAARLRAAFAAVRTRTQAMQTELHSTLDDVAQKLTPEQRMRMANALWHFGGKGGRDDHAM